MAWTIKRLVSGAVYSKFIVQYLFLQLIELRSLGRKKNVGRLSTIFIFANMRRFFCKDVYKAGE